MPFTDEEKVRVRHHLGYPNVASIATFALGIPAAFEPQFVIESAMNLVLPAAETKARALLAILDQIEDQMVSDLELLAVEQVDEIKINTKEQEKLVTRYQYWGRSLANVLGCEPNPADQRFGGLGGGGGGINVGVQH